MVLSNRVGSPTRTQKTYSAGKARRRAVERDSPFGGMNQRYAGRVRAPGDPANTKSTRQQKEDSFKARITSATKEMKALKMQKALAEIPYSRRARIKEGIKSIESFRQFDLLPKIQAAIHEDALKGLVDVKPSPIQSIAIPALLGQSIGPFTRTKREGFQSFLLAAETGSGKTLAYLAPALDSLKRAEAEDEAVQAWKERRAEAKKLEATPKYKGPPFDEPHPNMARPKVIILVPTAELVEQVGRVVKSLSHQAKFMSEMLSSNLGASIIHRNVFSSRGVDVITATPHLLASIAESDPNVLSRVSHLIVDEADSLMDRSFSPVTIEILDKVTPSLKQLVLCSATIPKRLDNLLAERFPDMNRITTPNLHAIPRRIQMGVIDVTKPPYQNNKLLACHDALWSIAKESAAHEGPEKGRTAVRRVMVFVNERETTQEVADFLASKGVNAVALHRDTPEARQSKMLSVFTQNDKPTIEKPEGTQKRGLQNVQVLVATDLAARGIDTLGVRHVVLYDVPHSTIDFIHRLGRAGRMGRRGRGIILLDKKDRRDVVAEVRESMFLGQALI
ncbi:uncharacterized protein MKZ38_003749 [Zalerion maritima]|uniref:RNA helicase n=1 Tax=Zalerion maritima TaxID=339359 RepID=A0AAD5RNK8_9PEZI|nr:uncharacterized protein MKZ38_003749 [Zalerion maritima]